jgi:Leucine-rich repeat (LRR) protein
LKKTLALFLIACLLFAFAVPTYASPSLTDADKLQSLGLLAGMGTLPDGSIDYGLDVVLSREQAITMIVNLLGKYDEATSQSWDTPFTDVASWAAPFVGYAYTNGITSGTSATLFGSKDPVSAKQFLTFVLNALDYTPGVDFYYDFAWVKTNALGLTQGQFDRYSAPFLRGDAISVLYQSLFAPLNISEIPLYERLVSNQVFSQQAADHAGLSDPAPLPESIFIQGEEYSTDLVQLNLDNMQLSNSDIEPLKYMKNLEMLRIGFNFISDLRPLSGLTNLHALVISGNPIDDLTPLTSIPELERLVASYCSIRDLSQVPKLTSLMLQLDGNEIQDIRPLAEMTDLVVLSLSDNPIQDIQPLSKLSHLYALVLNGLEIRDIRFLQDMTLLTQLGLVDNEISDLSPLAGLTNLEILQLDSNAIRDISPLAGLSNLFYLTISDNLIRDLHPLAGLESLSELFVFRNPVQDWSPVSHVNYVEGRP